MYNKYTNFNQIISMHGTHVELSISACIDKKIAVKKVCGPQEGHEQRCEIQGGGQEMALMVG